MRLRDRLLGTYLAVGLVLTLVAGGLLYRTATGAARAGIEDRVATAVRMLSSTLERGVIPAGVAALDVYVDALARSVEVRITIVAPDGRVVADSEFDGDALAALDNHNSRTEVVAARAAGEGQSVRYSRSVDTDMLYHARRVDAGPWAGNVARVAVPFTRVDAARATAARHVALALGLALALAVAAGALWARRLSRPIGDLSRAARRVQEGDLEARVRVSTGDELEDLARALDAARNQLAERIGETTAERERLEAVLDGMVEGVLVTDAHGRVTRANPALYRIFGLERKIEGRTVLEAVRHSGVAEAVEDAAPGADVSREIRLAWPIETALTLHAVRLPGGGAVVVFHDITALKRVEAVRRDFVANVSHELRTPLTALSGYAEALDGSGLRPEEVREHAGVIRRHVERLAALVSDLLELARLEEQGFAPRQERFDVAQLVAELAREWRTEAERHGMTLGVEVEPGLTVDADRRLLRQALANLLENAVKYCRPGDAIRIAAHVEGDGIELSIADTGPGIPYDDQGRVFERFYRVDKGRSRANGGTGLGLSIVKHIAEAHGGSVALESRPGTGSTFRITIPGDGDLARDPQA